MSRARTTFILGLLAPLLPLALVGCSDDPEPKVAPEPTESGSVTPAGDESLSPVATVKAWVKAQNEAMRSGDASGVRELSAEDCRSCDGLIDPVVRIHKSGGHFETAGWQVDAARVASQTKRGAKVNVALVISKGRTIPSAGADPVSYDVDKKIAIFKLSRDSGVWLVSFIGFLS